MVDSWRGSISCWHESKEFVYGSTRDTSLSCVVPDQGSPKDSLCGSGHLGQLSLHWPSPISSLRPMHTSPAPAHALESRAARPNKQASPAAAAIQVTAVRQSPSTSRLRSTWMRDHVTPPLPSPAVPPACLPPSSPLATRRRPAAHVARRARGHHGSRALSRAATHGVYKATGPKPSQKATSSSPTSFGGSRAHHRPPARHLRVVASPRVISKPPPVSRARGPSTKPARLRSPS